MNSNHAAQPPSDDTGSYEELVDDALAAAAAMSGWDFGYLRGRTSGEPLPWSYGDLARDAISRSTSLLDLDTGGGEMLASLAPLPSHTVATEGWGPNVLVAKERLEHLGVEIRQPHGDELPVADGEFDLVLNRHAEIRAGEVWRALSPGGCYLMQQPGSRNDVELNDALGAPRPLDPDSGTCAGTVAALERHGFRVSEALEAFPEYRFHDIAAVIYQLTVVSWHIPAFDVHKYDAELRQLDLHLRTKGPLVVHNHRYLIKAIRPSDTREGR